MSAETLTAVPVVATRPLPWLFSAPVDLAVFLGSAAVALAALAVGAWAGLLDQDAPDWTWVAAVLLVDVAHVWATGFRVYWNPAELRRRPLLYSLVPVFGYCVGVALFSEGPLVFWRTLAYLAVFHFVRQQYGWVALYRARAGDRARVGSWIDAAAIYLAMLYPLVWWHAHLPRRFWWFLKGDFVDLPALVAEMLWPVYVLALVLYAGRAVYLWTTQRPNPGKDVVVATTAVCWYAGIVAFNSDYAFTVTNVLIHGVPYLALVYWYWHVQRTQAGRSMRPWPGVVAFLGLLWLLAYAEELLWDRSVWQERGWLFGQPWDVGGWKMFLVPLLALPQLTHYVLDGFIWRRKSNPELTALFGPGARPPAAEMSS